MRIERALEEEAAALIAHGDRILLSIRAAHELQRWIGSRDLGRYLADTLPALFPGSAVRDLGRDDLYEIRLTQEARVEYGFWLQQRRLPGGGRLERETGPVTCRLARPAGPRGAQRGIEAVTQTHPLVRFVSERLAETDAPKLRPAIAARVASASLRPTTFVPPGRYAVLAMLWRFGGGVAQERIAYAGVAVPSGEIIPDDDAERLMLAAAEAGAMWPEAASELLTEDVAELCEGALLDRLAVRFATERSALQAERQDRASSNFARSSRGSRTIFSNSVRSSIGTERHSGFGPRTKRRPSLRSRWPKERSARSRRGRRRGGPRSRAAPS